MKFLLMSFLLTLPFSSFSQEVVREFDVAEETVCHEEYKAVGCVNQDGVENTQCIEKRLDKVSSSCQTIHWEKKKKK